MEVIKMFGVATIPLNAHFVFDPNIERILYPPPASSHKSNLPRPRNYCVLA